MLAAFTKGMLDILGANNLIGSKILSWSLVMENIHYPASYKTIWKYEKKTKKKLQNIKNNNVWNLL